MTLVWLAMAWFAGIGLAAVTQPGWWPPLAAAGGTLAIRWRWRRSGDGVGWSLGLLAVLLLGTARAAWASRPPAPGHVAEWNDRGQAVLRGWIAAEPARRDRGVNYRLDVEAVRVDGSWVPAHGRVLVQGPRYPMHGYGETAVVTGTLESPPVLADFDYPAYLARQGVYSLVRRPRIQTLATGGGNALRRILLAVKDRARAGLAASLPEPEASLATGILLGDDDGIPRRVAQAFQVTNTTHVIAISGSNIALLVTALTATLGRLAGRRRAFPVILVVLGLYTALVGADPAVTRAAVMGAIMLLGLQLGRPGDAATALCAAGWAMTLYRPAYLWDLGFQLSFAATAGLIVFAEWFASGTARRLATVTNAARARTVVRYVNEAVLVTLAAQITTWPLIAFHTGQVSLAGLVANFLILPAQPPVMGLGALTAVAAIVSPTAGRLVGAVAWLPLAWTVRVVEAMAQVPLATVTWRMGWAPLVAYYGLVAGIVAWRVGFVLPSPVVPALTRWFARERPGRREAHQAWTGVVTWLASGAGRWAPVGLLGIVCALTWVAAAARPDGRLHVLALDVGQGDAILVITPNGRRMLVDGGPSPSAVLDQLGRRLSPWDRRLDVVVLTHPDTDHVGGLPAVLARYRVAHVLDPGLAAGGPDAEAWRAVTAAVAREGAWVHRATAGGRVVLDDAAGVTADVLWPPEPYFAAGERATNDNSVVLRITYGAVSFLLTGDLEAPAEAELLRRGSPVRATVLKVGHHGSATSTTDPFLAATAPWLALISVGADNRFGHPAAETLTRLAAVPVWRTDERGTVEVVTDGAGVWVR